MDYILTWNRIPYQYRFLKDGTYVHVRVTVNEPDYSGLWCVKDGIIHVTEFLNGGVILRYEFVPFPRGFQDRLRDNTYLSKNLIDD